MNRVKKVVDNKLLVFGSEDDRSEAIGHLLIAGLKHYSIMYPQNPNLDLDKLAILTDKYVHELDNHVKFTESTHGKLLSKEGSYNGPSARKYRPDAMAHFPFADETGSVPEALADLALSPVPLLDMGVPGRNRRIQKVFDEMRFDSSGIRLSDLPEALQRVGINISSSLRRMLERTRSKEVNGPIGSLEEDAANKEYFRYMEKHIPLQVWKKVVQNFLILMEQGIEPQSMQEILPPTTAGRKTNRIPQPGDFDDESYEDESDYEVSYDESGDEEMKIATAAVKSDHSAHPKSASRSGLQRNKQKAPSKTTKVDIMNKEAKDYLRKVKNTPSRLSEIIRHDRQLHNSNLSKTNNAAFATIAKRRVDKILANSPALGFGDPNYFPVSESSKNSAKSRRRMQDLNSGTAALEIAEAFLQGPVAKEILSGKETEGFRAYSRHKTAFDEVSLSPREAQIRAAELLGIYQSENVQSEKSKRQVSLEAKKEPPSVRSFREREHERVLEEESKHLYDSGWRTKKGGWVADFGPEHTKLLYKGPENHRRNQRLNTSSISQPKATNPSTSVSYAVSDSEKSQQNEYYKFTEDSIQETWVRDAITGKPINGAAILEQDNSNSSIDAAVAGAGLGGTEIEDFDIADAELDDESLSKLQESVSLRNFVKEYL